MRVDLPASQNLEGPRLATSFKLEKVFQMLRVGSSLHISGASGLNARSCWLLFGMS